MAKVIGFVLVAVGLVVSALAKFGKLSFLPSSISGYASYLGIGLIVLGFILLIISRNSSKEVPIYQGNKIVGYRRA